jgi:hypothetical protein
MLLQHWNSRIKAIVAQKKLVGLRVAALTKISSIRERRESREKEKEKEKEKGEKRKKCSVVKAWPSQKQPEP